MRVKCRKVILGLYITNISLIVIWLGLYLLVPEKTFASFPTIMAQIGDLISSGKPFYPLIVPTVLAAPVFYGLGSNEVFKRAYKEGLVAALIAGIIVSARSYELLEAVYSVEPSAGWMTISPSIQLLTFLTVSFAVAGIKTAVPDKKISQGES